MKVAIINGSGESGKDTFIEMCKKQPGVKVESLSTIDMPKAILTSLGLWDGKTKGEGERRLMSDMKDMITRYNDGIFHDIIKRVKQIDDDHERRVIEGIEGRLEVDDAGLTMRFSLVPTMTDELIVFIHCREPEEIQKLKDHYGHGCITLLVDAGRRLRKEYDNHADRGVGKYHYDVVVSNSGPLQELEMKAAWFMNNMKHIFLYQSAK